MVLRAVADQARRLRESGGSLHQQASASRRILAKRRI